MITKFSYVFNVQSILHYFFYAFFLSNYLVHVVAFGFEATVYPCTCIPETDIPLYIYSRNQNKVPVACS